MAPKEKKTKAQIAAAAASGGKGKKKKWSKGKQKDKLNNAVFLDKVLAGKLSTDIPKAKLITPAVISERYHLNVSLARQVIKHFLSTGDLKVVGDKDGKHVLCTRSVHVEPTEKTAKQQKQQKQEVVAED